MQHVSLDSGESFQFSIVPLLYPGLTKIAGDLQVSIEGLSIYLFAVDSGDAATSLNNNRPALTIDGKIHSLEIDEAFAYFGNS